MPRDYGGIAKVLMPMQKRDMPGTPAQPRIEPEQD
jgi:hypothetical protein